MATPCRTNNTNSFWSLLPHEKEEESSVCLQQSRGSAFRQLEKQMGKGRKAKSGRKRPPQRGLGVAQLEKLRMEEEEDQAQVVLFNTSNHVDAPRQAAMSQINLSTYRPPYCANLPLELQHVSCGIRSNPALYLARASHSRLGSSSSYPPCSQLELGANQGEAAYYAAAVAQGARLNHVLKLRAGIMQQNPPSVYASPPSSANGFHPLINLISHDKLRRSSMVSDCDMIQCARQGCANTRCPGEMADQIAASYKQLQLPTDLAQESEHLRATANMAPTGVYSYNPAGRRPSVEPPSFQNMDIFGRCSRMENVEALHLKRRSCALQLPAASEAGDSVRAMHANINIGLAAHQLDLGNVRRHVVGGPEAYSSCTIDLSTVTHSSSKKICVDMDPGGSCRLEDFLSLGLSCYPTPTSHMAGEIDDGKVLSTAPMDGSLLRTDVSDNINTEDYVAAPGHERVNDQQTLRLPPCWLKDAPDCSAQNLEESFLNMLAGHKADHKRVDKADEGLDLTLKLSL